MQSLFTAPLPDSIVLTKTGETGYADETLSIVKSPYGFGYYLRLQQEWGDTKKFGGWTKKSACSRLEKLAAMRLQVMYDSKVAGENAPQMIDDCPYVDPTLGTTLWAFATMFLPDNIQFRFKHALKVSKTIPGQGFTPYLVNSATGERVDLG